jgi:hypothetical protein
MATPAERRATSADGTRLGEVAVLLMRHGRTLVADYALLAILDARMAAVRFGWMIGTGLIAAVLVVTAWLALVAAAAVWLAGTGMSWIAALVIGAAVNVGVAVALVVWIRGRATELPFGATLRQLRGESPPAANEPSHAGAA